MSSEWKASTTGRDHFEDAHAPDGVGQIGVAAAQVEADWDIELAGLLIEGQEVGVASGPTATFAAFLQDSAGTVFFDECHLLEGFVHAEEGHGRDPTQAIIRLGPLAGHPAVVRFAQGKLDLGAAAHLGEEEGGVHHLDVDTELVHVTETGWDVGQLACLLHCACALVVADASQAQLAVDEPVAVVATRRSVRSAGDVLVYGDGPVLLVGIC